MELLCPHCLKKVTVSDDKAGQVLNCPLCQGVFAAPALAPAPTYSAPPPPPMSPPPVTAPPAPPLQKPEMPAPASYTPAPAPPLPKPAPPSSDYTRRFAFRLRPEVLVCIPPPCLFLIVFVLSFFGWHGVALSADWHNLWGLAF